ncbi:MAG: protein kinase [Myxococcales bacterium]|nr:protein kinase [Myxococcales bacterium]
MPETAPSGWTTQRPPCTVAKISVTSSGCNLHGPPDDYVAITEVRVRLSHLDSDHEIFLRCPRSECQQVIQGRSGARCATHGLHLVTPDLVDAHPLLDRYQPVRRIAEGGFATIQLAIDLRTRPHERWVVIKRLTEEQRKPERHSSRLRFRTEGELLADFAQLPGVVRLIEAPFVGQEQVLILEYIDGLNISQCITRLGGRLEYDKASRVLLSLLVILSEIHRQGVVHRDIKPANIMLTELAETPGEPTRVCLLDFGIAKRLRGVARDTVAITQQGMVLGTMCYMAPEQRVGKAADQRSDIYSVGATFFHMLAGYPPFQGTAVEIAHLPPNAQPLPLPSDRYIPPQILKVLERAMTPEPARRYASADEMLHDLANAIAEPVPSLRAAAPEPYGRTGSLVEATSVSLVDPITADDDPPPMGVRVPEAATIITDGVMVSDQSAGDERPIVPSVAPAVVARAPVTGGARRVHIPSGFGWRVALSAAIASVLGTAGMTCVASGPSEAPRLMESTSTPPSPMKSAPAGARPDAVEPSRAPGTRQWVEYELTAQKPAENGSTRVATVRVPNSGRRPNGTKPPNGDTKPPPEKLPSLPPLPH